MDILVFYILIFINVKFIYSFGYGRIAQIHWQKESRECGGYLQSPISINSSMAVEIGMPALETIRYRNMLPEEVTLQNNGHSIALTVKKTPNCYDFDTEIPYIFGALLNNEYVFEGLHFHWGGRNSRGSEHILDDIRYPAELHLIHRNRKYRDLVSSLEHNDGLTVLGIFLQLRDKNNDQLDHLLQYFPHVREYGRSLTLNVSLMLSSLMPHNIDRFYTYKGSLTTPPCSEAVTWIVFPNTIPISLAQLNEFRKLRDKTGNSIMADNYRIIQPLGHRRVLLREPTRKHVKYFSKANFLKWNWFSTQTNQID